MKKRMLASILTSSLAVMSLSFFGLSASAGSEMVQDTNEIVAQKVESPDETSKDLVTFLEKCEDNYHSIRLYHNDDTRTAFKFSTADIPHILQFLMDVSDTFDDGMTFGLSPNAGLKFPDADVTIRQYQVRVFPDLEYDDHSFENSYLKDVTDMNVTNHGAIVYVDANGEEHSFSGFPDLENYIIQNYDVTVVDYDKYVEDGSIVAVDAVTTPVSNTTATSYFTGDVTGDGAVDLMDAISLNKIFAGLITPTDVQTSAADINQDGSVADDDLTILMQFLIGLRSDLTDVD